MLLLVKHYRLLISEENLMAQCFNRDFTLTIQG
jgi:hypothetical protein